MPTHLQTRAQLNAWEQANISRAVTWLRGRRDRRSVLDARFLTELHRRMFDQTWRWAGHFRTTGRNLGVAPDAIAMDLTNLLADTQFWVDHHTYPVDEIAIRFHHRLVSIHPFPNGNGRHARLATDALLESLGRARFMWGSHEPGGRIDARSRYLRALRAADRGDVKDLLEFARS